MRRIVALVTLVALVALAGCSGDSGAERLPDRELTAVDGTTTLELRSLRGQTVVVNFWATWCGPCRSELPAFQRVHADVGESVWFVGINVERGGDAAQAFLDELGVDFEQFVDPEGELLAELNLIGLPVTVILDADGSVRTRHIGALDEGELRDLIAA
ncbi:MAG: TlpA family protein disulfide reductase [Acidimicrobiia bacterium]